jgi:uncharacterized cupin superfamily protein
VVAGARLEHLEAGLTPVTEGWFVVNVRDAVWVTNAAFGAACIFEGEGTPPFGEIGFTLAVLQPGKPNALYHRESTQEDFLVIAGECLLLVEGEERRLGAWDFVHCPPETDHIFVGAGDGPCVIFMAGGRTGATRITYPRSELALRHRAGVETETTVPREAKADFPEWKPGPPRSWDGLPWASS